MSSSQDNKIIILGSGTSYGSPSLSCLKEKTDCLVCFSTDKKNIRTNTSILLCGEKNILVDCGKLFYKQYSDILKKSSVSIDSVLITHEHADAINGLDFLFQLNNPIPVYSTARTISYLKNNFSYLTKKLHFEVIGENFFCQIIEVEHGSITALGFIFYNRVAYFSDISDYTLLTGINAMYDLDILIIECTDDLLSDNKNHLSESDVKNLVRIIRPKRVIITGISHNMPHGTSSFEMAYDGMEIKF